MGPSISLLVAQRDCLSCFIQNLKVSPRFTLIQNRALCPLRLLPLMTKFFVFMLLQGIALGLQNRLQNCMENKSEVNQNKIILGDTLIALWIKWARMVKIKHKYFIDVAPIIPCQNLWWIMNSRIYGEGRTKIHLSSLLR